MLVCFLIVLIKTFNTVESEHHGKKANVFHAENHRHLGISSHVLCVIHIHTNLCTHWSHFSWSIFLSLFKTEHTGCIQMQNTMNCCCWLTKQQSERQEHNNCSKGQTSNTQRIIIYRVTQYKTISVINIICYSSSCGSPICTFPVFCSITYLYLFLPFCFFHLFNYCYFLYIFFTLVFSINNKYSVRDKICLVIYLLTINKVSIPVSLSIWGKKKNKS